MRYAYENLGEDQFEKLVVMICQKLFGMGVQGFAKGKDGGKDAKFVGTAELYPSKSAPWVGTTIIQAKHTNGYNKNFSESDFFSAHRNGSTVLGKEIPRIKKLRSSKQLDNYMLFANRRLSAITEQAIVNFLAKSCDIPADSIRLCGVEQLELWLREFSDIPRRAQLDENDSPLIVSPDDLAEVVLAFARNESGIKKIVQATPPTPRTSYTRKNKLNNMTEEYAELQRRRYLKETANIQAFLAAPENDELLQYYESAVEEFQFKIIAKRKSYQTFDVIMNRIIDLLFDRDPVLRQRQHKRLTRALLFYMYWNCDIGRSGNAKAN